MRRSGIRTWYLIHKWSSLVATLFLLMLCVTGLPLIFHDEIDALAAADRESSLTGPASASAGPSLDAMLALALADRPGEVPLFMAFSQDSPLLTVTTGPAPDAEAADMTLLFLDRAKGTLIGPVPEGGVMDVILGLHTDMLMGLPGMLFLGVMGLAFVLSLISGTVLYAPFMRRLPFGIVRMDKSPRVGRIDQHNFVGIVILGWALVIGLTGAINAFADPLTEAWRNGELRRLTADYSGQGPVSPSEYSSIDAALAAARTALPGRSPQFVAFPGGAWSTGHHYAVFFQGDRPLTSHLLTPALIDARSGQLTDASSMPLVNQALMMSKPLHFGDYGGLPLKIIWALLTLATIWMLCTGIMLWLFRRPGAVERRVAEIVGGGRTAAVAD
jgi:uncharacterized iron-regulated membrane protein